MSVSQHYEPEALIALLNRDSNDGSRDEHVASCAECAELLDVYRSMAVCLSDEAVWNTAPLSEEPVPQTISRCARLRRRCVGRTSWPKRSCRN